jgi:hypothetical protein
LSRQRDLQGSTEGIKGGGKRREVTWTKKSSETSKNDAHDQYEEVRRVDRKNVEMEVLSLSAATAAIR